jgi:hypothetical protein
LPEPPQLLAQVQAFLVSSQTEASETTLTRSDATDEAPIIVWSYSAGQAYCPVLLSHSENGEMFVTGVAVLAKPDSTEFKPPLQLAATLSRFYARTGETSLVWLAE